MQRVNYLLFYLFALFIMAIPSFLRHKIADGIALIGFWIAKRYRFVVHTNLELVFPKRYSFSEKDAIAKQCMRNLLREVLSVIEIYFTPNKKLQKLVRVEGEENLQAFKEKNQGVIFFTNHYNNLEIAALGVAKVSNTLQVTEAMNNPYIDAFVTKSRQKNGLTVIPVRKAVRHLALQLKRGGDVSIVIDQSVNADAGIPIDLFGHKTLHLTTASYLARKFDAPLVPTLLEKDDDDNWVFKILPPVPFTKTENEEEDIKYLTQAQANFLKACLDKDPIPWFWCHKRWKRTYPEIYNFKESK